MKRVRGLVAVLAVALVVGVAFTGTALAQGPWGEGGDGGEAVCEDFVDVDNDGICDNRPEGRPFLWSESEDWESGMGYRRGGAAGLRSAYGDADGDGYCDGTGEPFVDEDNDGICDNRAEGHPLLRSESEDWEAGSGRQGGMMGRGRGRTALQES
jgi:hypothetical protein